MAEQNTWPNIVLALMAAQGVSLRALARLSENNRTTLRKFLSGKGSLSVDKLERVFAVLGYEMEAIPIQQRGDA